MNGKTPFFSVIVACCEVAPYLPELHESLLRQAFTDFECILVVETSRDNTLELCRKMADCDPRFRVVTQKRSGSPAAPRNTGIRLAAGRYAFFVDGDDWLPDDALAVLEREITAHDCPEVVQTAVEEWLEDERGQRSFVTKYFNYRPQDSGKLLSGKAAIIRQSELTQFPFPLAALSICRIDFLKQNELFFVYGLKHEDEEWTPRVLYLTPRVLPLDAVVYFYRRRAGSITTASQKSDLKAIARVAKCHFRFCAQHDVPRSIAFAWQKSWLSLIFYVFFAPKSPEKRHSARERLAVLRHWLKEPQARKEFAHFEKCTTLPKKIGMKLMRLCTASRRFRTLLPCDWYFKYLYYPLTKLRGN